MKAKGIAAFAGFVSTILLANWMTSRYGLLVVGGVTFTAGTLAAGLSFGLRDACHEAGGVRVTSVAILTGGCVSWVVSPSLALASTCAFLVSEFADLAVYQPLHRRRWVIAVIASNIVGAFVDTVVFLHLAGFPIRSAVAGQMAVKVAMILPALLVVKATRR